MTNDARLLTDGARPAISLERDLADPPEVVWSALTDREQLRTWFPCDVIVDGGEWRVGAAITFAFSPDDSGMTLSGEVLTVDEPHHLAFTWGEETLRFELTRSANGTRLVLIDELPADGAARNAAGWDVCLDRLVGTQPGADWKQRFETYTAVFEPQLGPQVGPPAGHEDDAG